MTLRSIVPVAVLMAVASLASSAQAPQPTPPRAAAPPQLPPRDQAPPLATGRGVLRGRVTRLDNDQPLRQVLVSLTSGGLPNLPSTFTDNDGRFELAGLPAASYTITASKTGFVTLEYGQRRPFQPGRQVALTTTGVVERLDFALLPAAVVTGRIVDEDGDACPNITVRVLRERYTDGRPLLSTRVALADTTDDRAEFRIYGIPPGTYYLSATRQTGRSEQLRGRPSLGTSTSFYPGAWSPEAAQRITLAPGQVAALPFGLVPAPTAKLTVRVRTADGLVPQTPSQLTRVTLTASIPGGDSSLDGTVGSDGSFSWDNLPPGEYLVSATVRTRAAAAALVSQATATERAAALAPARLTEDRAATRVMLAGSDVRVALTTLKPDMARGRITFDADASSGTLSPERVRIMFISPDPLERILNSLTEATARTNTDWTFETSAPQGAMLPRISLPAGWVVKSIHVGDADVTDTPLIFGGRDIEGITILLTDRLTEVSGVVRDGNGKPVDDATVVLFADDPGRWRYPSRFVAAVRADQSGRFNHRGLPPARYVAVALDYLEDGQETNPESLRRLQPLGARFALADRESTTVDLTLSALP